MSLRWKVCGMRDSANIREVLALKPDYMGFIFFEKSPRHAEGVLDPAVTADFPDRTIKTGVFVNAPRGYILQQADTYGLQALQLHGHETPEQCRELQDKGFTIFKVFSVGESFDFETLEAYVPHVDYFLFDTKGKNLGGNGVAFDWNVLKAYPYEVPIILSGGVDTENVSELGALEGLPLHGIDVNSRFETQPALKDTVRLIALTEKMARKG
ncbi:phosphoribosylanthranilate isomerase [Roseivirga sp. BDSF3-8]|uniref:phosphoribosylanthranilate isomerase n=1 Tax=Roseivirga sp. BDSF3-8 TaxID=3241598 RepID=UPI0035320DAA